PLPDVVGRRPHELGPDLGGEGAAGDAAADAVVAGHRGPGAHRRHDVALAGVLVAHPHRGGEAGPVPDEPGVAVLLGGAGLAGHGAADVRRATGAGRDDQPQAVGDEVRLLLGEDLLALRGVRVEDGGAALLVDL